ncbi:translation initiation factor IF-2 [Phaeodactylibacter luteus]|uniref:Translation initiation factor IF-2 n=1 Tax=Phaeodactylibacter luteus TaxID=1564516 RepID=A0A5C6RIQ1_9BACT|nr:translation initiation factor IF-2 [Phaeodactylibacter luteus]TXB61864.1 translation initiation factor IF-2 [Phaeodactylibacter luteus]
MAKRLVKIAKELNVGTSTIVDHLTKSGFDIENKPTAKISDEMYTELLKEFQKSIAIKEKADQLVIGSRPAAENEKPKAEQDSNGLPPLPKVPPAAEAPQKEAPPKPKPLIPDQEKPAAQKPAVEQPAAAEKEPEPKKAEEPAKRGPKILGKIDLDARDKSGRLKQKPVVEETPPAAQEPQKTEQPETPAAQEPQKTEKAETPKPEAKDLEEKKELAKPAEAEDKKTAKPAPSETEAPAAPAANEDKPAAGQPKTEQPAAKAPAAEEGQKAEPKSDAPADAGAAEKAAANPGVFKAEAPELRGLKILGKIDVDKVDRSGRGKKKKKDEKKDAPSATPAAGNNDEPRKKRKRKRKKVAPTETAGQRSTAAGGGKARKRGNRKEDEVKEVSQKEIEDKIKATMARISGGGKRKRQKLRRDNRERLRERQEEREMEMESKFLEVTEFISVQELANLMDVPVTDVIMTCMNLGVIVSINQRLDAEIIELVAEEFEHEVKFIDAGEQDDEEEEIVDDPEDLQPRAPIVTVMGHVDHGKTSLLDHIRKAKVADAEAGGITQHIGAYEVNVGADDKRITFLDTPGHEAFTAMRARGAKVTDIAIIIIAADDNIMPQTKEAISHAQAAGVPMVFAINKVDKPGAQPERIKQELASMDFLVEEWGGKYQSQDISAKTGQGIDELLEKILLEAEILELQANPDRFASGTVIEASLDKGRGYVTKLLVQTGTLQVGDPMVAGEHSGKVKAMFNEFGKRVKEAGPSTPVLVLGLGGAPQAGERFRVLESEQETRQLATKRAQIAREQANRATKRISLDEIGRRLALGSFKELNLIVKGDVDGSVEALSDSLIKQSIESVQVNVIHKAVGQIIESDVLLASASDAIIIGFQVRPSLGARKLAEREGVEINTYSIIYEAIEEIRSAIEGMLEPTKEEKIVAQVEVREVFKISKVGTVAGCYVQEGKITRNTLVRVIRDGIVIYPTKEGQTAELSSLKRFKDDVREVKAGFECGLSVNNYNDIKVGDTIEGYEIVEIKQTLD